MGISRFIQRRWAAHNQRLLNDQLYEAKLASDPIGGPSGDSGSENQGTAGDSRSIIASAAENTPGFGQGGDAGGSTGPSR